MRAGRGGRGREEREIGEIRAGADNRPATDATDDLGATVDSCVFARDYRNILRIGPLLMELAVRRLRLFRVNPQSRQKKRNFRRFSV